MSQAGTTVAAMSPLLAYGERWRTADRIFRGALVFNVALTAFWLFSVLTHHGNMFFQALPSRPRRPGASRSGHLDVQCPVGLDLVRRQGAAAEVLAGFAKEERRQAFSSRMKSALRRIRLRGSAL